jgi:glycosyltransferase involved in cell wall biosynthesis
VLRIEPTGAMYAKARSIGGAPATAPRVPVAGRAGARRSSALRAYAVKAARTYNVAMFCVRAARVAAGLRPDVYHCHDFDTLLAGRLANRRHRAKQVYDSHELYGHLSVDRPMRLRAPAIHALERFFLRGVDASIAVSDSFADHLVRDFGIARPVVLRNIPDTSVAPESVAVPEAFRTGAPTLLYVGGIQRARGIEETVRAVAQMHGAHLVVMGPGFPADEARVRALVAELGLGDRVHLVPPVRHEDVTTVSSHATLAVIPFQNTCLSHYLTIPNKIFEALHAGLPVVAADFPELRAIVERFDCGRVCDASDPSSIAAAVKEVLADRERLAANARAAASELTWDRERERLLDLYAAL